MGILLIDKEENIMFNEIKEKRLMELQFINKVEMLITKIVQTRADGEIGWDYIEDPGWSFEDSPQFSKNLSKASFDIKRIGIKYNETHVWTSVTLYVPEKVFQKKDDKPFKYWYGDNEYHAFIIDGWYNGCDMLAEFNFWVDQFECEEDIGTDIPGKRTQFKILISLDKFNTINVDITTEYNQDDHSDFFVEVCDLDETDEDMGRVLTDPKLPREKLVEWFSSILRAVDNIFDTKYERTEEGDIYPYNGTSFPTRDEF